MGYITYDGLATQFDDRLLAHLQIVIVQALRNNKSFLMSWKNALEVGDGRSSIWLHQNTSIRFTFDGSRTPSIDRDWVEVLSRSAESSRGLVVMNEEGVPVRSSGEAR